LYIEALRDIVRRDNVTPPTDDSGSGRSTRWLKSNLVTLGSAAVLAVYAAGYARTRTAAAQFADEPRGRRAQDRPAHEVASPSVAPAPQIDTPATTPAKVDSATAPATTAAAPAAKPVAAKTLPAAVKAESVAEPAVNTDTASKPTKTVDVTPPAVATTPVSPASPPPTPPVDSGAKTADTAHVQLKDGTFSAWGTSRHGDIEAAVEIKNGRIVSAFIVQCLTQYSCSWISALPPQVVTRQSAEVDYVSGATQSSNAFYYAIVESLKKAK
jgi:uncharacterized protein with FMN-binding domain